jgi:hypothetical protein
LRRQQSATSSPTGSGTSTGGSSDYQGTPS